MRRLEDAIVRLLKRRPFYGQLLLQFRRAPYRGKKTLAVTMSDAVPVLMVDDQGLERFSRPEQEALLEHLLKHILHLHPCRRGDRHPRLWDLACDLAINPGIRDLPPEAVQPERFRLPAGLAAEEYYQQLPWLPETGHLQGNGDGDEQRQQSGECSHSGSDPTDGMLSTETIDDHQQWQEADRTPLNLSEQVVRQLVSSALRKSGDEVPSELQPVISRLLAPPTIPWQQILRQFVGNAGRIGRSSTWKRAHRRFGHATPGIRKQQLLNLVVGIDVSESTDTQPLREQFAAELLRITQGRQSRITVLYAGSRIEKIEQFSVHAQVIETYRGGGFTDLRPVFDYAARMQPRPAALIYLTDGYGPAPGSSAIPTLWVLSPDGRKPVDWGLELRLDTLQRPQSATFHPSSPLRPSA